MQYLLPISILEQYEAINPAKDAPVHDGQPALKR